MAWQVLKYASYCSSLTKPHIIEIFQSYLNQIDRERDAREELCSFLDVPDLDEVVLNSGMKQRLMMVAANFRKEVTSTALWLLGHGVNVQCFKVTPYSMDEQLFLNIEQIVPTPEAKELMIGMSAKEADEKTTEAEQRHRHNIRIRFWDEALEAMRQSTCDLFNNISSTKDHWSNAGSGFSGVPYTMIFCKNEARVEISIARASTKENKFIFDRLYDRKAEIEEAFGAELQWERLDNRKACRIKYSHPFESYNSEHWPEIIDWLIEHMIRLEKAFRSPLSEINEELKRQIISNDENITEAAE